jgi:hypothetical protein
MHQRSRVFLWASIAIGLAAAVGVGATRIWKSPPPPTRQEVARNQCAEAAFVEYLHAGLALSQASSADPFKPTIEFTIARRRLQEKFCLQFATCVFPVQSNQSLALQHSLAFESCLRDEVHEQYDAD